MAEKEIFLKQAEALRLRKEFLFKELTRIHELTKGTFTEVDAEVQLRACTKHEGSYEKLMEAIITLNVNLPREQQVSTKDFSTFQTLIDAIVKHCLKVKKGFAESQKVSVEREEAALPRLALPVWEGDLATWNDFKAQFEALVHYRPGLGKIIKLQYLKRSLRGEPLSLINQYPLLETSYDVAYEELIRRYENKRRLASFHLNKILSYKNNSGPIGREHIKFINVHRSASTAINQLGIQNLSEYLLFELSYRNLSARDQRHFDLERNSDEVPSIKELLAFTEKLARSEELHIDAEAVTNKTAEWSKIKSKTSSSVIKKGLVTTKRLTCYNCKEDHLLFRCPKLLSLPVSQRRTRILKLGCCISCFYKHPGKPCASKYACKICSQKDHNTILHEDPIISQASTSASAEAYGGVKSCNSCNSAASSKTVLLGTIWCRVEDSWGEDIPVRAVLDPGSEISIITSSLANRLGLPKSPPTCHVEGVGQNLSKPFGNVTISISSEKQPNFSCRFVAPIMQNICEPLPKSAVSDELKTRFQSLELADPYFCQPGRIHLLLGADIYSDLVDSTEPTSITGNPSALRTKFGYVILGRIEENCKTTSPAVSLKTSAQPL